LFVLAALNVTLLIEYLGSLGQAPLAISIQPELPIIEVSHIKILRACEVDFACIGRSRNADWIAVSASASRAGVRSMPKNKAAHEVGDLAIGLQKRWIIRHSLIQNSIACKKIRSCAAVKLSAEQDFWRDCKDRKQ